MTIQPERPQSIGGVLDSAFQLYKASVFKVWPTCLLFAIVTSLPTAYMLMSGTASADPFAALQVMSDPLYWAVYCVTMLLTMWLWAALYQQQGGIGAGQDPGAAESLKAGIGRALPLLLMTILFMIALFIGLVLLVIPGLILMVSLMLGANLLVFEGKGPVAALQGSHQLVWGNWWRTAVILTVGFIIVMVIYMLVGLIVGIVIPILGVDSADFLVNLQLTSLLVTALMTFLVMPFYVALLIAVYWDLKLRKEGGDLAARVAALGAA
jgi:hypothetical protein